MQVVTQRKRTRPWRSAWYTDSREIQVREVRIGQIRTPQAAKPDKLSCMAPSVSKGRQRMRKSKRPTGDEAMRLTAPELVATWRRIEEFTLDDPDSQLTFTRRLARENGWTLGHAVRVVDEYKRFMFLAVAAGHSVTPSEDVDQAWHLHLVYTESYWRDFCGAALGRRVQHGPTRGGGQEQTHFALQYERTLASYEQIFGTPPPADIWHPAEERFGDDLLWRRVNLSRYWVIPKPCWFRRLPRVAVSNALPAANNSIAKPTAAAVAALPLTLGLANPLDFTGPTFLVFFALATIMAIAASLLLRWVLRASEAPSDAKLSDMDPLQLALLQDQGRIRFAQAGMAALVSSGRAAFGEETSTILGIKVGNTPTFRVEPHPVIEDSECLRRLQRHLSALGTAKLADAVKEAYAGARQEEEELKQRGLLTDAWYGSPKLWLTAAPLLAVLMLGLAKISVGIARDRPVAFLVIGCAVVAIIMFVGFFRKPRRTTAGDKILAAARLEYQALRRATEQGAASVEPASLALAVGLFGTTFLAGSPLDQLHSHWPRNVDGGGASGGCGGGCGGGGCGGGCGGCGGCGG